MILIIIEIDVGSHKWNSLDENRSILLTDAIVFLMANHNSDQNDTEMN